MAQIKTITKDGVARITFTPSTGETRFKTRFTTAEQDAIADYLNNTKKYLLTW